MSANITVNGNITIASGVAGDTAAQHLLALASISNSVPQGPSTASAGTSPVTITLPSSPTKFVFVQNTHASQTLTITWTPAGGSENPVIVLSPNEFIIVGSTAGITSLKLTGSASATTASLILL